MMPVACTVASDRVQIILYENDVTQHDDVMVRSCLLLRVFMFHCNMNDFGQVVRMHVLPSLRCIIWYCQVGSDMLLGMPARKTTAVCCQFCDIEIVISSGPATCLKNEFPSCETAPFMVCSWFCRYAFIHYSDEEVCRKAHDSSQELVYQNRTLVVMYGKKAGAVTNPPPKRQAPAAKRM